MGAGGVAAAAAAAAPPATVSSAGPSTASTMDVASVSAWSRPDGRTSGDDVSVGVECTLKPWKKVLNEGVSPAADVPPAYAINQCQRSALNS